jgi:hypothetical protein
MRAGGFSSFARSSGRVLGVAVPTLLAQTDSDRARSQRSPRSGLAHTGSTGLGGCCSTPSSRRPRDALLRVVVQIATREDGELRPFVSDPKSRSGEIDTCEV